MKTLLLSLFSLQLFAHDLYLLPQKFRATPGEKILLSAHTGDGFPLSEHAIDPARLTSYPALPEGSWRMLGSATHATVPAPEKSGFFAISSKARFLEMEPHKFEAYLKEEGLNIPLALRQDKGESQAKSREMYSKYAKTYVVGGNPSDAFEKPLGLKIEFVPLADPAALKPGATLPVMLLFDGKPLAGVQVEAAVSQNPKAKSAHKVVGRTDAQGRIDVRLTEAGKVRLHCVQMERVSAPTHEWESFWASLTFEVTATGTPSSEVVSSQ